MVKKRIEVDLGRQVLQAFQDNKAILTFECVSGDSSHPTDAGLFRIFRKHHPHWSHTYNVQMNYAMFFTLDGKAIHQYHGFAPLALIRTVKTGMTDLLGSHGCVRLKEEDARTLYQWTPVGTFVHIK